MKDVLLELLLKEFKQLDDSTEILKYSYEKCQKIRIKRDYCKKRYKIAFI